MEELELAIKNSSISAGDTITFEFQGIGKPRMITGVFSETVNEPRFVGIMLGENRFCGAEGIHIGSLKKV